MSGPIAVTRRVIAREREREAAALARRRRARKVLHRLDGALETCEQLHLTDHTRMTGDAARRVGAAIAEARSVLELPAAPAPAIDREVVHVLEDLYNVQDWVLDVIAPARDPDRDPDRE